MSKRPTNEELQRELAALGESPADADEREAAERLADGLDGELRMVDPKGDGLDELARALRQGASGDRSAGEAVTGRLLDELYGDNERAGEDRPADDLEQRRAAALAGGVERLLAGLGAAASPTDPEVGDLLQVSGLIHASTHAERLSPSRLNAILEEVLRGEAATPQPAHRRRGQLAGGVLALAVAAKVGWLVVGVFLGPPPPQPSRSPIPRQLTSRSTRDILPGPFPREQSASQRMDLIYHDRLASYRALELGALAATDGEAGP